MEEVSDHLSRFAKEMNRLIVYLSTGFYSEGSSKADKKKTFCQSKTHVLENGTLFYIVGGKKRKVVTSRQQVMEVLHANHSHAMGGHSGINATLKKISQGFWWHRMKNDVQEYISSCLTCQGHEKLKTQAPELKPIKVTEPLELVGMDLIGSLDADNHNQDNHPSNPHFQQKRLQREKHRRVREAVHHDRQTLQSSRELLQAERLLFEAEKEAFEAEQNALQAKKDVVRSQKRLLKSERQAVKAERRALEAERKSLDVEKMTVKAQMVLLGAERRSLESETGSVLSFKSVQLEKKPSDNDCIGGDDDGDVERGANDEEPTPNHCVQSGEPLASPLNGDTAGKSLQQDSYQCEVCSKLYRSHKSFIRHVKLHASQFHCRMCQRPFSTQEELARHKEDHSWICPVCGDALVSKFSLEKHRRLKHAKEELLACTFPGCHKRFFSQQLLGDHINVHAQRKPHACLKCGRRYASSVALVAHKKGCGNPDAHVCNICGARLSARSTLVEHKRRRHSEKRYTCLCGVRYAWRSGIIRHRKKCPVAVTD